MEADPPESASTGAEDNHWLMVRGTCSVCSYTVASDSFRIIDEKNRDSLNKYFSTHIENGIICMTCYNEYLRWRKDTGEGDETLEEKSMTFPFCYGVVSAKEQLDLSAGMSDEGEEETETEESSDSSNDSAPHQLQPLPNGSVSVPVVSAAAAQTILHRIAMLPKREATISPAFLHLHMTAPQEQIPTRPTVLTSASPASSPASIPSSPLSNSNGNKSPATSVEPKIKKKSYKGGRLAPLGLTANSATSDLSYLSTLKVSELQEQLKRYNASTKGSKAQLIQRLVRYICLFNTNRTLPSDMSYLNILRVPHINLAAYSAADLEMVTAVAAAAAAEQDAAMMKPEPDLNAAMPSSNGNS